MNELRMKDKKYRTLAWIGVFFFGFFLIFGLATYANLVSEMITGFFNAIIHPSRKSFTELLIGIILTPFILYQPYMALMLGRYLLGPQLILTVNECYAGGGQFKLRKWSWDRLYGADFESGGNPALRVLVIRTARFDKIEITLGVADAEAAKQFISSVLPAEKLGPGFGAKEYA